MRGSVCLFSSYFNDVSLPVYVRFYLTEINKHFDNVIFITHDARKLDEESLNWLEANVSHIMFVNNEGYDFGMWKKAIIKYPETLNATSLGLLNDSCICFGSLNVFFDWQKSNKLSACGMVKSYEKVEHLQSYFLVFNGSVVHDVCNYICAARFENVSYYDVIKVGEFGLSEYLLKKGIKLSAFFDPGALFIGNPSFLKAHEWIDEGMPLIKRKLFLYPRSDLIEYSHRNDMSWRKKSFIKQIARMHPESSNLFADLPANSFKDFWRFLERILRFWFKYYLTR
jgi:lipopolysaccharide biosynthesis protein